MYYENVGSMTDIINEDVKYTSAWYKCINFYTFAGCFSLFTITEFVVLFNIQFTECIICD